MTHSAPPASRPAPITAAGAQRRSHPPKMSSGPARYTASPGRTSVTNATLIPTPARAPPPPPERPPPTTRANPAARAETGPSAPPPPPRPPPPAGGAPAPDEAREAADRGQAAQRRPHVRHGLRPVVLRHPQPAERDPSQPKHPGWPQRPPGPQGERQPQPGRDRQVHPQRRHRTGQRGHRRDQQRNAPSPGRIEPGGRRVPADLAHVDGFVPAQSHPWRDEQQLRGGKGQSRPGQPEYSPGGRTQKPPLSPPLTGGPVPPCPPWYPPWAPFGGRGAPFGGRGGAARQVHRVQSWSVRTPRSSMQIGRASCRERVE